MKNKVILSLSLVIIALIFACSDDKIENETSETSDSFNLKDPDYSNLKEDPNKLGFKKLKRNDNLIKNTKSKSESNPDSIIHLNQDELYQQLIEKDYTVYTNEDENGNEYYYAEKRNVKSKELQKQQSSSNYSYEVKSFDCITPAVLYPELSEPDAFIDYINHDFIIDGVGTMLLSDEFHGSHLNNGEYDLGDMYGMNVHGTGFPASQYSQVPDINISHIYYQVGTLILFNGTGDQILKAIQVNPTGWVDFR